MRRLLGIAVVYAVGVALAIATPLSATEQAAAPPTTPEGEVVPAEPAPVEPTPEEVTPPPAQAAPATPVEPAPAPAPPPAPEPAPAPAAPAPAGPAAAPAPEPAQLRDELPVRKRPRTGKRLAVAAASTTVDISDFEFSPASVTVDVGDTVTWRNSGPTEHSAKANDGSFDTGLLDDGQSGSQTFDEAGTFKYICEPHPFMKGTVTVQASGTGGSDSGSDSGTDSGTAGDNGSSAGDSGSTSGDSSSGDSGSSLPATGLDTGGLAAVGLMTLALGAYLRRRASAQPQPPAGRIGW